MSRWQTILSWSRVAYRHARRIATSSARVGRRYARVAAAWTARTWKHATFVRWRGRVRGAVFSVARVSVFATILSVFALAGVELLSERVPVARIGVRQTEWGGGGVVERDFSTGMYFSVFGLHRWHLLDARTHFASFGYDIDGDGQEMLDLRTKEGNQIRVGVVVPYHIRAGEAHQLVRDGLKSTYPSLVRATVRDVLMQELANLTAADFADPEARLGLMEEVLPRLNALLARYHIAADSIHVHDVFFWKQYEEVLQRKQLSRQHALLAEAATQVEEEMLANRIAKDIDAALARIDGEMQKETEALVAERRQAIAAVRNDTMRFDRQRRADAEAEYARLLHEGDMAVYAAESLDQKLSNASLDSPGGRIHLARQAAHNLNISEVVLDTGDPEVPKVLDLDAMVELLVGG